MINPYALEKKTRDYLDKVENHVLNLQKEVCFYLFLK